MNVKIYLRSSSEANGGQLKKEGRTEIQEIEYLENEKSFLDKIKKHFS